MTKTETVYLRPPTELTEANEAPRMPVVPEGDLVIEDLIRWHDEREARWRKAWQESEADKRAIRDYLEAK